MSNKWEMHLNSQRRLASEELDIRISKFKPTVIAQKLNQRTFTHFQTELHDARYLTFL